MQNLHACLACTPMLLPPPTSTPPPRRPRNPPARHPQASNAGQSDNKWATKYPNGTQLCTSFALDALKASLELWPQETLATFGTSSARSANELFREVESTLKGQLRAGLAAFFTVDFSHTKDNTDWSVWHVDQVAAARTEPQPQQWQQ